MNDAKIHDNINLNELASIESTTGGVQQEGLRELALFAGAGGGILGGKLLGWRTICAVEINAFCARRLMQRQNEGHLSPFPIWDDVCTFDGRPWRGRVDVVSGGFPCQDISIAGKGEGIDGSRSGLWKEFARIILEVRPEFVFVENSPHLVRRGLARVLGNLASMGYNARWGIIGAENAGAPHARKRLWIVANASSLQRGLLLQQRRSQQEDYEVVGCGEGPSLAHSNIQQVKRLSKQGVFSANSSRHSKSPWDNGSMQRGKDGKVRSCPYGVPLVANGMAAELERLRSTGNGQVPAVVRLAWRILTNPSFANNTEESPSLPCEEHR